MYVHKCSLALIVGIFCHSNDNKAVQSPMREHVTETTPLSPLRQQPATQTSLNV